MRTRGIRWLRDHCVFFVNGTGAPSGRFKSCGCYSAGGRTVGKQINLDPLAREVHFFGLLDGAQQPIGKWETLIGPKRTQIGFRGPL